MSGTKRTRMKDYCYINPARVDSFFSQINGSLVEEQKEQQHCAVKGLGKVGIEIGCILAKLGLAKGTGEGQLSADYGKLRETTSSLSPENKLGIILAFHELHGTVRLIDLNKDTEFDSFQASLVDAELLLFNGYLKATIPDCTEREIREAFIEAFHFMCRRYGSSYGPERLSKGEATLVSQVTDSERGVPLVQVPLFFEHIIPNQVFVANAPMFMPMEVMGSALVADDHVVVNPLAICLQYR